MIKLMQNKKLQDDQIATKDELFQTLEDLSAEESDSEFAKTHGVRLRRPPRTSQEALKALQEADARFELGKAYLAGGQDKL